jgi:molybdate transport system substrate-binding protein
MENDMAQKNTEISRRDFLKQSAALGVGAVVAPYIYRDACAASRDRVTIYHNTVADSVNPYNQSSGSIYGNWQHVIEPKIKIAQGGRGAMELLAKGEVDIGLTFISEIITEPGVEVVGPLPRDISTPTALVGFVSAHSKEPDAANALLRYLSSPEAAAVYKQRGMQPGRLEVL